MSEITSLPPYGNTIFCDDIRQELGGKFSLMGVYNGYLLCQEFPLFLPRFGTLVSYYEAIDAEILPLKLTIYFPGDKDNLPSYSQEIQTNANLDRSRVGHLGEKPLQAMIFPILHPPINFAQEGSLKIRMERGGDIIKLGQLYIATASRFAELAGTTVPLQ